MQATYPKHPLFFQMSPAIKNQNNALCQATIVSGGCDRGLADPPAIPQKISDFCNIVLSRFYSKWANGWSTFKHEKFKIKNAIEMQLECKYVLSTNLPFGEGSKF